MRSLTLFLAIIGASSALASEPPKIRAKTNYEQARTDLKYLGWAPVTHEGQRCGREGCFDRCAPGFEQRCVTYPEAEICRGTGLAGCDMIWRRGNQTISVETMGEEDPPLVRRVICRAGC